jgi:hypothetical protein
MCCKGMLDKGLTPAALLQARRQTCEPCVVGKMRRVSHSTRAPPPIGVLHRVHMDRVHMGTCHGGTMGQSSTRPYAMHGIFNWLARATMQQKCASRLPGVRNRRVGRCSECGMIVGGEYMSGEL